MYRRKNYLILIWIKLTQSVSSIRVWAGYIYGFWFGLSMGSRYVAFSSGMEVGIFESFLLLTNHPLNIALLLIGFFVIIADAPFIDTETYYILIRSDGSFWRISMVGYILVQVVIYEAIIFTGGMLPGLIRGNWTAGWSEAMQILTGAAPRIAITTYDLPILDPWMLKTWTAPIALFHSFGLIMLYCFLLGLIVFVGNLNTDLPIGNLAAIGIHFVGMLVMSDFVPLYWPSLVAHGILQYHIPGRKILSLHWSYLLFFVCIIGVLGVLRRISRYTNYNTAVSQKTW